MKEIKKSDIIKIITIMGIIGIFIFLILYGYKTEQEFSLLEKEVLKKEAMLGVFTIDWSISSRWQHNKSDIDNWGEIKVYTDYDGNLVLLDNLKDDETNFVNLPPKISIVKLAIFIKNNKTCINITKTLSQQFFKNYGYFDFNGDEIKELYFELDFQDLRIAGIEDKAGFAYTTLYFIGSDGNE
jgi:hypothetical protein